MKRYTVEWALAPKQVRMTRAQKPKPFPGKYPTRIAWKGILTDGKPSSYIGKPTRKAIAKYCGLLRGYQFKEVCIVEFDRTGVIARDKATNVLQRTCDVAQIRKTYHPFPEGGRIFPNPGQWRQLLQGNKPCLVFWPDSVPVIANMVPAGYTLPPLPTTTAPEPAMFTIDMEDTPVPPMPTTYDEIRRIYAQGRMANRQMQEPAATQAATPRPQAGDTIRYRFQPLDLFDGLWGGRGRNNGQ